MRLAKYVPAAAAHALEDPWWCHGLLMALEVAGVLGVFSFHLYYLWFLPLTTPRPEDR